MLKQILTTVLASGLVMVSPALAQYGTSNQQTQPSSSNQQMQTSTNQQMPTGKDFIKKVAEINLGEVALGKLAQQKASDPAVKEFGKLMEQDHSNAQDQLRTLAQQKGVTLPSGPGAEGNNLKQQLSSTSGNQFDKTYVEHMLSGHKKAIAMLENEVENGQDQAIKNFAEKVLPTIQDHIRIAENIAGQMSLSSEKGLSHQQKAITASVTPR